MKRILFFITLSFLLLLGLFFYHGLIFFDGHLHLTFCNVGQGDGILIRSTKGQNILVDGGPDDAIIYCLSNHLPFWDRKIDLVIRQTVNYGIVRASINQNIP